MATDRRVFTLRIKEEVHDKVKFIAEKNKRSMAMQIEYLIEQHIEQFEKENGIIKGDQ